MRNLSSEGNPMTRSGRVSRAWALVALAMSVAAIAAVSFIGVTYPLSSVPIFYQSSNAWDSTTSGGIGGEVKVFLADSTVRVGSVVFISSRGHVKGSATLADFNATAGVVVGGDSTSMQIPLTIADTGIVAAKVNNKVIVMTRGRYWVLDSALNSHVIGGQIRGSGLNQRAALKPAALDSLSRVFARVVDTTGTGSTVLAQINVR